MSDRSTSSLPQFPKLPKDGKEFFNILMARIEPDLTLEHVHTLREQYAHETLEEHASRIERYKKALVTYRQDRDKYFDLFHEQVRTFSRDLKHYAEDSVRQTEQDHLETLESYFQ